MSEDLEEGVAVAFLPKKEEEGVVDGSASDECQGKGESVPLCNDGSTAVTSQQAIDVDTGDPYIEKWVGVQMRVRIHYTMHTCTMGARMHMFGTQP